MSLNPTNRKAVAPKVSNNGSQPFQLLQPAQQAAYTAVGAAYSQAEVTAIRNALVAAGIMKAS